MENTPISVGKQRGFCPFPLRRTNRTNKTKDSSTAGRTNSRVPHTMQTATRNRVVNPIDVRRPGTTDLEQRTRHSRRPSKPTQEALLSAKGAFRKRKERERAAKKNWFRFAATPLGKLDSRRCAGFRTYCRRRRNVANEPHRCVDGLRSAKKRRGPPCLVAALPRLVFFETGNNFICFFVCFLRCETSGHSTRAIPIGTHAHQPMYNC